MEVSATFYHKIIFTTPFCLGFKSVQTFLWMKDLFSLWKNTTSHQVLRYFPQFFLCLESGYALGDHESRVWRAALVSLIEYESGWVGGKSAPYQFHFLIINPNPWIHPLTHQACQMDVILFGHYQSKLDITSWFYVDSKWGEGQWLKYSHLATGLRKHCVVLWRSTYTMTYHIPAITVAVLMNS